MFGKKQDASPDKNVSRIEELEKRIAALEEACAPIRVGKLSECGLFWPYQDTRPKVTLHQVAVRLMEHCGLTFERVPPTPERIEVVKANSKGAK